MKVVLIHTSPVSLNDLKALFKEIIPDVEMVNIIDDSLLDEVKKNGKWCYARAKESFVWTAVGIIIPGNSSNTEEYDLSHYGTLKPGEYRLAVGESNACIYAYFTVNADGSFTYPG